MATPLDDVLAEEKPEPKKSDDLKIPVLGEELGEEKPEIRERSRKRFQQEERDAREAGAGRVRDAEGKYVAKEEKPKEEAKPEAKVEAKPEQKPAELYSEREKAYWQALNAERHKRQELEKQLKDLSTKPPAEQKAFWDDPEGHFKQFEERLRKSEENSRAAVHNTVLRASEMIARSKYKDFDAAIEVFAKAVEKTPGLGQQWMGSPDPAEFAYQSGKTMKELSEAGDINALRAKIAKEERTKLEAEFKAKTEKEAAERAALPGSLSGVSAVPQKRQVWGGPTPLDSILSNE